MSKKLTAKRNFARTGRKTRSVGPNKVEQRLWKILGHSFEYTGNGSRTIGGKRPDFINENAKIIVELYGDFWHKDEPIRKTLDRINLFKAYGYKTLIVWEHEVDPVTVKRKLALL